MRYVNRTMYFKFARLSTKVIVLSAFIELLSTMLMLIRFGISKCTLKNEYLKVLEDYIKMPIVFCIILGSVLTVLGIVLSIVEPKSSRIKHMIRKGLFAYQYGNPLHLKDGELLPRVKCRRAIDEGNFILTIYTRSIPIEEIQDCAPNICAILNRKFSNYAVTVINSDVSCSYVSFLLEDVTIDKSFTFHNVSDMKPESPTRIKIQVGTEIDLTTSGSILVAGKTRSGKTTGIISILIQALLCGCDSYNSRICIIDPKKAELSVLPGVVTVDDDGEAKAILKAVKDFADLVSTRQQIMNDKSKKLGDSLHWWDIGMHPCFLFIDEYVACRTLYPRKAEKESDYCIATFDSIIKRIVTMGASAGCFVIISIAEASVDEGGLPTMLKNAMSTKVLFRPTMNEGRLMWNGEKLKAFSERVYNQGDAWFSSTDGIHDDVSFVHFPHMDFPVYRELGRLLANYDTV